MWLINTETLRLESVVNPETVKYAILSHTWEDEEVSFQEFQDLGFARTRKGFAKIEMTCLFAKSQGYPYAWVDTCCIDKSSSAELSEAINSMFRWYKDAQYCYAYLSDYHQTTVDSSFGRCKWFTRGWTLQELIAPRFLTFYNQDWESLGSKIELHEVISKITTIDSDVLLGECDISTIDVVYRMSWAAGRETTRAEDIAYCLFGIFDVNLPMLYGEGEKAFLRLQEEICQRVADLTLFAWKTDADEGARIRGIFARSPDEFAYASSEGSMYRLYSGDVRVSNRGVIFDDMELLVVKGQGLFMPLNLFKEIPDLTGAQGGIFLEKLPDGYARVKTDQLFQTELDELEGRWLPPEQINVISRGSAAISLASSMIHVSTSTPFTIVNVSPRRQWDPYREAFIRTAEGMVDLDVDLGNGQPCPLLVLFYLLGTDAVVQHDIVERKWASWSNAMASIGKADLRQIASRELAGHFYERGQDNMGEVKKIEDGWQVWLSRPSGPWPFN
ncbi:HET domain-containing protein [Fusarium sp. Ph1]|nr:HET domain-containing protein [Fusarium sp. Ph1]